MTMTYPRRRIPLLLWPLVLTWRLITFFANIVGILLTLLLGVLFMVLGLALCASILGAVLGIPLFILGFMLLLRGLY